jgi:hypothetical protein
MIDNVRNTVLSILSKDNRGYITPMEFNLYADQAQKEIFESYFYQYSGAINRQNAHLHGDDYANIPGRIENVIDTFIMPSTNLIYDAPSGYFKYPLDYYKMNRLMTNINEAENVSINNIWNLTSSNLTSPTVNYPVYTMDNKGIKMYPQGVYTSTGTVKADYIRYPKAPKWTFISVGTNDPLFNPSALDYQDFELPASDMNNLIVKILQYAGLSIRESEVVQVAKQEEIQDKQEKI